MAADDTLPLPPPAAPDAVTPPPAPAPVSPDADTIRMGPRPPVRPDAETLAAEAAPAAPITEVAPGQARALGAIPIETPDEPPVLSGFAIGRLLGRGGTGTVYEATQHATGRVVALKVLHSTLACVIEAQQRFLREARSAMRLDHPHIVRVIAAGEEDGVHFIAFERVSGRPLQKLLESSPIPAERAARWTRDLADALVHAHERGVLHRDVKPANVLVTKDWQVLLLDFGLARPADAATITGSNDILGTPGYMAPEQILSEECDERTDVYGLGGTLFAMLEGTSPYPNVNLLVHRHELMHGAAPEVSAAAPAALAAIALTCLARETEARYPSAEAVRDDIDRYIAGGPTWAEKRRRSASRRRWLLVGLGAAAAIVAGAFAARAFRGGGAPVVERTPVALDPEVELRGSGEARLYDLKDRSTATLPVSRWSGRLPSRVRLPAGSWLIEGTCRTLFVTPGADSVEVCGASAPEGFVVVAVHGHGPFLIGRTEVTVKEYYEFLEAIGGEAIQRQPRNEKGHPIGVRGKVPADSPIFGISWEDAVAFARWKGARLPTMDEWGLACQGADGRPYPWGRGLSKEAREVTNEAALFQSAGRRAWDVAPCGAVDMYANAGEWVDATAADGARILRGCLRMRDPERWCGYDSKDVPKGGVRNYTGFRLAMDLSGR